jgi:hypothetical protein
VAFILDGSDPTIASTSLCSPAHRSAARYPDTG